MNQFEKQFLTPSSIDDKIKSQQNLGKIIEGLSAASPYQRSQESETVEKISSRDPENKKFSELGEMKIEHIKDSESPKVEALVDFMTKFEPEEADTPEIIRDAIANPSNAYAYHIIENRNGEVISHIQSSYLELAPKKEGEPASQAIIFNGFAITREDMRRKHLAAELYQSMMRCNLDKAKAKEQEVKAVILEGKEKSEPFWNNVGLRRMYYQDNAGNFNEIPYIQPPIDWNKKTGLPRGHKPGDDMKKFSMPEHLMIQPVDGRREISAGELMPMIDIIYQDNYVPYRNEGEKYPTEKAIEKSVEIVDGFKKELEAALTNAVDGKIYLLDAKEREQKMAELEAQGKRFSHFVFEKEA